MITIGGFIYHAGDYYDADECGRRVAPGKGCQRLRGLAGIRTFFPATGEENRPRLMCFGIAVRVDNPHALGKIKQEGSSYNPLSVPGFIDKGYTHYQWLPPNSYILQLMRGRTKEELYGFYRPQSESDPRPESSPSFAGHGGFLYYNPQRLHEACVVPVISTDQQAKEEFANLLQQLDPADASELRERYPSLCDGHNNKTDFFNHPAQSQGSVPYAPPSPSAPPPPEGGSLPSSENDWEACKASMNYGY